MVSNHVTYERVPICFHRDSQANVHAQFIFIAVYFFETKTGWNFSLAKDSEELFERGNRSFPVSGGQFLKIFLKVFGNGEFFQNRLLQKIIYILIGLKMDPSFFLFILV